MFSEPGCVYYTKTEWYLDLYMAYIFLNKRILQNILKMCVFSLGWNMNHWALLDIWVQIFFRLFLHNLGVLNSNRTDNILSLVSFTFQWAKQKMTAKSTSFLYLCCTLTHNFRFLHDLELINLSIMFLDKNDLYLNFKFKLITANTQSIWTII